jgi:hypothetical protein
MIQYIVSASMQEIFLQVAHSLKDYFLYFDRLNNHC